MARFCFLQAARESACFFVFSSSPLTELEINFQPFRFLSGRSWFGVTTRVRPRVGQPEGGQSLP